MSPRGGIDKNCQFDGVGLRESPMNRALLSLCVFGAGLATANILIMQRPTCPSRGVEAAAAYKERPSTKKVETVSAAATDKPTQALKAAATTPVPASKDEAAKAAHGMPSEASPQAKHALKPANPSVQAPKDADTTGSVKETAKKPNGEKTKIEDEPEQWAEVTLPAKVHNAPSVSSPTVRYYRVGTRLKVVGRESGWINIVDPTTSKEGWIYEKYLTPNEGPDQKKSAQAASNEPDDSVGAPPPPGPHARPYRPRKYGWKRYRYPPVEFAIGVYRRW
jgi:Bacterial SH3 domain